MSWEKVVGGVRGLGEAGVVGGYFESWSGAEFLGVGWRIWVNAPGGGFGRGKKGGGGGGGRGKRSRQLGGEDTGKLGVVGKYFVSWWGGGTRELEVAEKVKRIRGGSRKRDDK